MYTRKDYLNRQCSHSDYYAQFVEDYVLKLVSLRFSLDLLLVEYTKDSNFNTIPLADWQKIFLGISLNDKLSQAGDYMTVAGSVCILKEAARQIVSHSDNRKPIHKEAT